MHITDEIRMMKPGDSKTFPSARHGYLGSVARALNREAKGKTYRVERDPFCCTLRCLFNNENENNNENSDG